MIESFWQNVLKIINDLTSSAVYKGIVSLLGAIVGGYSTAYWALVVLMGIDFVTGVWAAKLEHRYSGAQAREKTLIKFGVYALVAVAARAFDAVLGDVHLDVLGASMIKAALVYLAGTELLSVMDNLRRTGHPIQIPLLDKLAEWLKPKQDQPKQDP
jgi:phage-related holin